MNVEVLSAYDFTTKKSYGSKERYEQVLSQYPDKVRGNVANYAAHLWDILLVDGRLIAGCSCTNWRGGLHGPYAYGYDTGVPVRIDDDPIVAKLFPKEANARNFSLE